MILSALACGGSTPTDSEGPPPPDTTQSTSGLPRPVVVASIPVPPNYGVHDTFVRDGIVFACAWNTGLILYDVGNGIRSGTPAQPVEISRIVTESTGGFAGARVHNAWWFHNPTNGQKRYVFVGQEGPGVIGESSNGDIHVVDVSDLAKPVQVARYHMSGTPKPAGAHNFWMDEQAQVLYAAFYNGGVVALDVSGTLTGDLAGREIARLAPGGAETYTWGVHAAGTSLFAVDMVSGLYQLQRSGGAITAVSGGANVPERFSSDLWVHGDVAYTGTWGSRLGRVGNVLKIWSLSSSGAPTLADSIVIAGIGTVSDVQVSADGKMLVLTAENGPAAGLYVYSLANPLRPAQLSVALVDTGLHTGTVADIAGKRYVFAAKNPINPELIVFDITALIPQ